AADRAACAGAAGDRGRESERRMASVEPVDGHRVSGRMGTDRIHEQCTLTISARIICRERADDMPFTELGQWRRETDGHQGRKGDEADNRRCYTAAERSPGAGEPDLLRPGGGLPRGDRRLSVGARTDPSDASAVSGHARTLAAREAHGAADRTAAAARTRHCLTAGQTTR